MVGSGCSSLADCAFKSSGVPLAINFPRYTSADAVAIFRFIHKVGGDHHRDAFLYHAVDVQPKFTAGEGGGSTPEVGSSRNRMSGSCISEQASASRCLKPNGSSSVAWGGDTFQAERLAHAGDFFVLRPTA